MESEIAFASFIISRHHCSSTCQAVYHWRLLRVVDCLSVAGGCSVELTARETVCLKTGIAPSFKLLPSWYHQLYLFRSARAHATNTNGTGVGPFRSILVSLNAVHHFQLHGNGIHFRLNRTEWNGNVTVFMPPTVVIQFII